MANHLISKGVIARKIVTLEAFDYLADKNKLSPTLLNRSIAIAGNLNPDKAGYPYSLIDLMPKDIQFELYGPGFNGESSNHISYNGVADPDKLPELLNASFGLVWDGETINGCSGTKGEYLRFNNPHKMSLYLAAGIPVLVWSQAAVAEFVKENKIGLTIDSLEEIESLLASLSQENYATILANVKDGWRGHTNRKIFR